MPETPYPPAETEEIAPQKNPDASDDAAKLGEPQWDDDLLDAFLPDDEYEPLPEWGDFWMEKE